MAKITNALALPVDRPTINGRYYPKDTVERAIQESLSKGPIPVIKYDRDICIRSDLEDAIKNSTIGYASKVDLHDNGAYIDAELECSGEVLKALKNTEE